MRLCEPLTTSTVITECGITLVKVALASPLSGKSKLDCRKNIQCNEHVDASIGCCRSEGAGNQDFQQKFNFVIENHFS